MSRKPLPQDTNQLWNRFGQQCHNLGLVLDKFQPWDRMPNDRAGWNTRILIQERRRGQTQNRPTKSNEAIGHWFKGGGDVVSPALEPNQRLENSKALLLAAQQRWKQIAHRAPLPTVWTTTPLAVGLGTSNTLETGMTCHKLYGFPFIPASSLKGLARAAAFFELAEKLGVPGLDNATVEAREQKKELTPFQKLETLLECMGNHENGGTATKDSQKAWADAIKPLATDPLTPWFSNKSIDQVVEAVNLFRRVFGWQGKAGSIIFFDSIPADVPHIKVEIMNPHFPDYYKNQKPPDDTQSPNPVAYLAVDVGSPYLMAIDWRGKIQGDEVSQAAKWLFAGLQQLGIGSKTSSGFGVFSRKQPNLTRPEGEEEFRFFAR